MKRKIYFIVFLLIVFSILITTLISCKDIYSVKIFRFENDLVSLNPIIAWKISPLPKGEFLSVLRIAKINEGETPESALKKRGKDFNICKTSLFQYLNKPVLETNSKYVFKVTVMDNNTKDGSQIYASSEIMELPMVALELSWFTVSFDDDGLNYFIELTPNYSPCVGDQIEWKLVQVEPCPWYAMDGYVENENVHPAPSNKCHWDLSADRIAAIQSAVANPQNPNDPILVDQGSLVIPQSGLCTVTPNLDPQIGCGNAFLLALTINPQTQNSRTVTYIFHAYGH